MTACEHPCYARVSLATLCNINVDKFAVRHNYKCLIVILNTNHLTWFTLANLLTDGRLSAKNIGIKQRKSEFVDFHQEKTIILRNRLIRAYCQIIS
jgi:hypothetical protein